MPTLYERRDDLPDLAVHLLGQLHRLYHRSDEPEKDEPGIDQEARQLLSEHDYSGNLRELRSVLLRALFFRKS